VESTGLLRSNALIASLQGRVKKAVKFKAQYTLSRSDDNTDGPLVLPATAAIWPGMGPLFIRHAAPFRPAGTSDLPRFQAWSHAGGQFRDTFQYHHWI